MHPSPGTGKQENSVSCAARAAPIAARSPSSILFRIALHFQSCGVIHVMTAQRAAQRTKTMTTFTIDTHNNITAHATREEAAAATTTPFDSFSSQPEFAELAKSWPAKRLVAIWSSLPGVQPVKTFKDHKAAASLHMPSQVLRSRRRYRVERSRRRWRHTRARGADRLTAADAGPSRAREQRGEIVCDPWVSPPPLEAAGPGLTEEGGPGAQEEIGRAHV